MKLFSAGWCKPCVAIKAHIKEKGLDVEIVDIETEEGGAEAHKWHVRGLPSVLTNEQTVVSGLHPCMAAIG